MHNSTTMLASTSEFAILQQTIDKNNKLSSLSLLMNSQSAMSTIDCLNREYSIKRDMLRQSLLVPNHQIMCKLNSNCGTLTNQSIIQPPTANRQRQSQKRTNNKMAQLTACPVFSMSTMMLIGIIISLLTVNLVDCRALPNSQNKKSDFSTFSSPSISESSQSILSKLYLLPPSSTSNLLDDDTFSPSTTKQHKSSPKYSWYRHKRSGISDQRLAELEEMVRIEMIRAAFKHTYPVAYGVFDPMKIGRRRKRHLTFDDQSPKQSSMDYYYNKLNGNSDIDNVDSSSSSSSLESEDAKLEQMIRLLLTEQNRMIRRQQKRRLYKQRLRQKQQMSKRFNLQRSNFMSPKGQKTDDNSNNNNNNNNNNDRLVTLWLQSIQRHNDNNENNYNNQINKDLNQQPKEQEESWKEIFKNLTN